MSEENLDVSSMSDEELAAGVVAEEKSIDTTQVEGEELKSEEGSVEEEKAVPTIEELQAQIEELKAASQKRISDKDRYITELRETSQHKADLIKSTRQELEALKAQQAQSDSEFITREDLLAQEQIRVLEQQAVTYEQEQLRAAKMMVEAVIQDAPDFNDLQDDMVSIFRSKGIPANEIKAFKDDPVAATGNPHLLSEVIELARIKKENREIKEKLSRFSAKEKETLGNIAKSSANKSLSNSSGQTSEPDSFAVPENWRSLTDEQLNALYAKQLKQQNGG
jgi:hypothetical protein